MKNILLLIHEDAGQESRLQVALDVARALDGHLECLDVMELPMIVPGYYETGAETLSIAEIEEQAAANRNRVKDRLAAEDVPWSMRASFGTIVAALERASDLADLIILSSREEGSRNRTYPERLPLRADRPVLAVPPRFKNLDTAGCALVAWDRSRPCNEAVRAAIPLLKCASEVVLFEVNQPRGAFAMAEMATYLSRHGITAELVERTAEGSIAGIILDHAAHRKASFIVMGAYSTPQPLEAMFGGVTRSMLLKSEVPLLVSH